MAFVAVPAGQVDADLTVDRTQALGRGEDKPMNLQMRQTPRGVAPAGTLGTTAARSAATARACSSLAMRSAHRLWRKGAPDRFQVDRLPHVSPPYHGTIATVLRILSRTRGWRYMFSNLRGDGGIAFSNFRQYRPLSWPSVSHGAARHRRLET